MVHENRIRERKMGKGSSLNALTTYTQWPTLFSSCFFTLVVIISILPWPATTAELDSRTFSMEQAARQEKTHALNTSTIFTRHLQRYGGGALLEARDAAGVGSAIITHHNTDFVIPVTVGASVLHLTVDTGSSDLWVFSHELPHDLTDGVGYYKPSVYGVKSDSQSWKIRYADGSFASGDVYHDVVGVGGVYATQQAIEIATNASDDLMHNAGVDGILGLGFSSLNKVKPEQQKTFFENVITELTLPLFAVTLKQDTSGSYDFGFINSSLFKGELSYSAADSSQGHWGFKAFGYIFGDDFVTHDPVNGVVDTGAALMFLPDYIVRGYYYHVEGAEDSARYGAWTVPCTASLPSFTVLIENYRAVVGGDFIKVGPVGHGSTQCLGGIQSNMGVEVAVFGDVFLKSQYVVFDARGPQLGFAPQS